MSLLAIFQNPLIVKDSGIELRDCIHHSLWNFLSSCEIMSTATAPLKIAFTPHHPPPPRRHALLIGVQNYNENPLDGSLNDVQALHDILALQYNFRPNDITLVTDNGSRRPTRTNILSAIHNLVHNAQANDSFLIYYAGHGTRYSGSMYSDLPSMQEDVVEAICPIDRGSVVNGEMVFDITDRDIDAIVSGVSARLTCIFDCCHSGTVLDIMNCRSTKVRYANPLPDMGRALYQKSQKCLRVGRNSEYHIFILACKSYQIALECNTDSGDRIHGAFTQALLHALESDIERTMIYEQLMGQIGVLPSQTPVIYAGSYTGRLWSIGGFIS
ncbi:uncharacterized protein BT62DRAFT_936672 [Guyanagaster necrorhizus]|uniref:Peptidase C14 caspase domain-containing protein n=1 Tax=Guyanagaster necrorhizus TaxID=856835 RepID=A0A9P7VKS0_9AGAR|nr:uncharacterized protein BT62DRAFT_936672 [Guyanagaster necrorhizus MCA 3950]KAG7441776.1 hypothetical protein BT62DRAFT_936672 [Guyanagaster necrorhizus MCA 3950]